MRITVVGTTGLIGSKGVDLLEGDGHDVVAASRASGADPANGVVNIGGPEKVSVADLARTVLAKQGADMAVVVDPQATYFGTPLTETSLVTGHGAVLGAVRFADWLTTH